MATTIPGNSSETRDTDTGDVASRAARAFGFGEEEAALAEKVRDLVRERPLMTLAAAGAMGTLGGLLLPRLARLVFVAAAGYIGTELWRREGRVSMRELARKFSR